MKYSIFLILLIGFTSGRFFTPERTIRICGQADFLESGDSVTLSLHQYTGRLEEISREYTVLVRGDSFKLTIPGCDQPQYLDIYFHNRTHSALKLLLPRSGAEVRFGIKTNRFHFYGPSAANFSVQQDLREISAAYTRHLPKRFTPETLPAFYKDIDACAAASIRVLESRKNKIDPLLYRMVGDDIRDDAAAAKLSYLSMTCLNKSPEVQESFCTAFRKYGRPLMPAGSSEQVIYQQYLADSCIFPHRKFRAHDCYVYESTHFIGDIRERLVTALFISKRHSPENLVPDMEHALGYIKNKEFRAVLEKIKAMNTVGAVAPDFTLRDADDQPVSLKDFRGKVIMLDFWFTGCGACRSMAPVLAGLEKKYVHQPVVFISVCIDKKRTQWLASLSSHLYTSDLSVNLYTEGQGDMHPVIRNFDVRGYPTFILIDRDGKIGPSPRRDPDGMSALIDRYL